MKNHYRATHPPETQRTPYSSPGQFLQDLRSAQNSHEVGSADKRDSSVSGLAMLLCGPGFRARHLRLSSSPGKMGFWGRRPEAFTAPSADFYSF
jgi:hypothetical protein